MTSQRANIGRLVVPAAIGLLIGMVANPHPAVFVFWAITIPWFIARKQGFHNGGVVCALSFALPACTATIYKVAVSPEISSVGFVLTAVLLSPVAAIFAILGLHFCGIEKEGSQQVPTAVTPDDAYSWIRKVPSTAILANQFSEANGDGLVLR